MVRQLSHLCLFLLIVISFAALSAPTAQAEKVSVHLDASQTGEPISPYIYGQFIEHLGRCIYGGIWAEMLEDRKFYYPVTDNYNPWKTQEDRGFFQGGKFQILARSPWKVVGQKERTEMGKTNSFVGEQTPNISLPGNGKPQGIEQMDLALIKNKTYQGYVYLAGDAKTAPIQVNLIWGKGKNQHATKTIRSIDKKYKKYSFQFKAKQSTNNGRLQIVGLGEGRFQVGTVSLMPADHIHGFRPDTLELMKQLDSPVYRWPGGNFVSDYDWKDGVGDRDKRPPRKNPAWTGIEPNDVGIHEFMQLCHLLETEPYIAVNTGLGSAELAAEEVEYCNGSTDTPMGRLRAKNGHPKPFKVKFWAVGNEMYGDWQLGHMPLEDYVKKHNRVVDAMREVDPDIVAVGVGAAGEWTEAMFKHCAEHMELISEHIYQKSQDDLIEHAALIKDAIRRVADAHRKYRKEIDGVAEQDIRIAMDEWNYWYGRYIYGELGVRYHLQDALGIAAGLHEYFRNSDLYYMANYAQTVNVIGAIKTSKTNACLATTGLVLKLYRQIFGDIPVQIKNIPDPLDISAALDNERKRITVGVVNPTRKAYQIQLKIKGFEPTSKGRMWKISGKDKMAHNEPGKMPMVRIHKQEIGQFSGSISVDPMSVSIFEINRQ